MAVNFGQILVLLLLCLAVAQVGEGSRWSKKRLKSTHQASTKEKSRSEKLLMLKKKLEHIDSSASSSSSESESGSNEGSTEIRHHRDVRILRRYGDTRFTSYDRYLAQVNSYYGQGYGFSKIQPYSDCSETNSYTIGAYNKQQSIPGFTDYNNRYFQTSRSNAESEIEMSNNLNAYKQERSINQAFNQVPYGYSPMSYTPSTLGQKTSYNINYNSNAEVYNTRMEYTNKYTHSTKADIFGRTMSGNGPQLPRYSPPVSNFALPNYYSGHYNQALDVVQGEYDCTTSYKEFKFDRYGLYQLDLFKEFFHSLDKERYNIIKDIRYPPDYTPYLQPDMTVDFIIIGAGPSGCLLANLLSQNFNWNVLLIEAGGHPPPAAEIPLLYSALSSSDFDWDLNLEVTDSVGLGMRNGEIRLHVGKGLGGSALTVPNLYYRGCVKDYQLMVEAGLIEYSFQSLIKYFIKTEHLRATTLIQVEEIKQHHGFGGPLPVSKITTKNIKYVTKIYSSAFSEMGYNTVVDINDEKVNTGYVDMVGHILKGRRMLPGKVFLSPIIQRPNFKLLTNTLVTKILIDTSTNTAYGVEFVTKHGQMFTVQATKEVILTAGAIGNAQLLMLSGIGPRQQLFLHNIDLVKDLNVGGNLKLNPVFTGATMTHEQPLMKPTSVEDIAFDYLAHNDGLLATFGTFNHACFLDTLTEDYPEVEFHSYYFMKNRHEFLCDFKSMFNYADEYRNKLAQLNDKHNLAVYSLTLLQPHSIGRVILESKNPYERPIVIGNLLSDERDVESLLIALEKISLLEETEAFKAVGSKMVPIEVEECAALKFKSKEYWKCALKYFTTTTFKPSGTCKMGVATDSEAVVNSYGQVHGVQNLRVAGSAVFPFPLSAYSSAPALMLAEKIAEHIMISYST